MNYAHEPPPPSPEDETPHGRVARYAWGDDYHDVLLDRLKRLQREIEELSGGKAYVDTGPLLEREIAERGGLGWVGKHTLLIRRGAGSWLLLGEILATALLEYGTPVRNLCGSCTRCIDACPTHAIVEPYKVDARKCISYLTIELKGSIPEELRPALGSWVFGCDVCQEVCPWNRKVSPSERDHFRARDDSVRAPDLIELVQMSQATFSERFRKSPIKRAKRRGLLRNAAVALGNSGDRRSVPALVRALSDDEALVREHAAWALGRLGGNEGRAALRSALTTESDPVVRRAIERALKLLDDDPASGSGSVSPT
jgi:epoxyqueuosine reductase